MKREKADRAPRTPRCMEMPAKDLPVSPPAAAAPPSLPDFRCGAYVLHSDGHLTYGFGKWAVDLTEPLRDAGVDVTEENLRSVAASLGALALTNRQLTPQARRRLNQVCGELNDSATLPN